MKGFSHLRYVGLLACLVLWELLSLLAPPSRAYFATPLETLQECAALVVSGILVGELLRTLAVWALGLIVGVSIGVLLGSALASSAKVSFTLMPLHDFLRTLPAVTLIPFAFLFLGPTKTGRAAVVAWAVAFVVALPTYQAIRHVNRWRARAALSLGLTGVALYRKVYIPDALPEILTAIRLALSIGLLVTLVAEMSLGLPDGIGGMIYFAGLAYRPQRVIAGMLCAGALGVGVNSLYVRLVERRWNWKRGTA